MGLSKVTLVCIVVACFVAVAVAQGSPPKTIVTAKTNMKPTDQQEARKLLNTAYSDNLDANRCQAYVRAMEQAHWLGKYVCFKYAPDSPAGNYYFDPSAKFIECTVTDEDTAITPINYLLFATR